MIGAHLIVDRAQSQSSKMLLCKDTKKNESNVKHFREQFEIVGEKKDSFLLSAWWSTSVVMTNVIEKSYVEFWKLKKKWRRVTSHKQLASCHLFDTYMTQLYATTSFIKRRHLYDTKLFSEDGKNKSDVIRRPARPWSMTWMVTPSRMTPLKCEMTPSERPPPAPASNAKGVRLG